MSFVFDGRLLLDFGKMGRLVYFKRFCVGDKGG